MRQNKHAKNASHPSITSDLKLLKLLTSSFNQVMIQTPVLLDKLLY